MMPFAGFISAYFGVRRTMTIVMLMSSLLSFGFSYIITVPNIGLVWFLFEMVRKQHCRNRKSGIVNFDLQPSQLKPFIFRFHLGFIFRVLLGIVHSPTMPLLQSIWTQWAPLQEKTRLVCCHSVGVPFGSVLIVRVIHVDNFLRQLQKKLTTQSKLQLVGGWDMLVVGEVFFLLLLLAILFVQFYFSFQFEIHPGLVIKLTHRFTFEYWKKQFSFG